MADLVNVPDVPGVPTVFFAVPGGDLLPALLTADAVAFLGSPAPWGIYLGGAPVLPVDNVVTLGLKGEHVIADYPIEQGGFASYDKVQIPKDVRVRVSVGGSDADRALALETIRLIEGDLNFYDIYMPEAVYTSVNIAAFDFHRSAQRGLGLLVLDLHLLEIRSVTSGEASGQMLSNTQQPSGTDATSGGTVQPDTPLPTPGASSGAVDAYLAKNTVTPAAFGRGGGPV